MLCTCQNQLRLHGTHGLNMKQGPYLLVYPDEYILGYGDKELLEQADALGYARCPMVGSNFCFAILNTLCMACQKHYKRRIPKDKALTQYKLQEEVRNLNALS